MGCMGSKNDMERKRRNAELMRRMDSVKDFQALYKNDQFSKYYIILFNTILRNLTNLFVVKNFYSWLSGYEFSEFELFVSEV